MIGGAERARELVWRGMRWASGRPLLAERLDGVLAAVEGAVERLEDASSPRMLYQMRAPRPFLQEPGIAYRTLDAGRDLPQIAAINHEVFAWFPRFEHFDLGGLEARTAAPGFDPSLVLVHCAGDRVAAYCWCETPRGPDRIPRVEDLAVHPDFAGRGAGRRLLVASLRELEKRSDRPIRFYVDAGNVKALNIYLELGCVIWRVEHDWRTPSVSVTEPRRP